jgi:gliding motility-associated lipoprotein GldH
MLKMNGQIKFIAAFLTVFLLNSSCGNRTIFKEYRAFDDVSWNRFDIQNFEVPVKKGEVLDVYFFLRHHIYFPYDYIDVNISFYMPGGETRSGDYHYVLKDKEGKWLSDGMGELWDIELPVRKNLTINETGICKIRIENKMTKLETPGIVEVGLLVKKADN